MIDVAFEPGVRAPGDVRIRVVVADDSLTVRKRLVAALEAAPDVLVVGEAGNGRLAVDACRKLQPDVLLLDIVMPHLDGVKATEEIMASAPTRILIVSGHDQRGNAIDSMSALTAGAVDAIEKLRGDESDEAFDTRLLRAVRVVARVPVVTRRKPVSRLEALPEPAVLPRPSARRELLAVGGSTGGPAAVVELLRALPPTFPLPILLVLHIGPSFGFAFADWLGTMSKIPVVEARDGAQLRAGHVHVCPPERHLVLRGRTLHLTRDAERHSCRPSVDVLFESVAESMGDRAIACLLTGIGRDGAEGLRLLRAHGALTMAQDEASSVVFGMPRAAILCGAAAHVLSPADMAHLASSAARVGRDGTNRRPA
ncbi:MAG TPA: chemotaxis-specific protein-glutamate methyltransferase CheB [Polyangiaceae bacterium]|nr:chemotaxis-specific protein-glutamate methyltransferase CheB [Polyangiaceae bacterium]